MGKEEEGEENRRIVKRMWGREMSREEKTNHHPTEQNKLEQSPVYVIVAITFHSSLFAAFLPPAILLATLLLSSYRRVGTRGSSHDCALFAPLHLHLLPRPSERVHIELELCGRRLEVPSTPFSPHQLPH